MSARAKAAALKYARRRTGAATTRAEMERFKKAAAKKRKAAAVKRKTERIIREATRTVRQAAQKKRATKRRR